MENQVTYFPYLFTTILFTIMILEIWKKFRSNGSVSKLPPGPLKLPFIGNLHLFSGTLPHHCLRDMAMAYGPVMHLQLGEASTFVFSSREVVEAVMKTHDLIFAGRPLLHSLKLVTYSFSDIVLAPYGDYWRQMRKICTSELLSVRRVKSFRSIREDEVSNLIRNISLEAGSTINLRKMLYSSGLSIISRAAIGGKCKHQEEFKQLVPEILTLFGGLSLVDLFPSIKLLSLIHSLRPKYRNLHKKLDEVLETIILEHQANKGTEKSSGEDHEEDDLLDVLLDLKDHGELRIPLTIANIKAIIMDLFTAGGESSAVVVEWAMSEMLKNPKVMEKAQAEVRHVFATKGSVDETGLHELKYLNLVIKETLRLHPPSPLLVARESRERCEINGFEIPAKSRVIVNAWAIGRDSNYWTEAEKFLPERFSDGTSDYTGSNFEFIPFGGGRRMCPGISFGMANIELELANLLFHFDWKLPDGKKPEDVDMTEVFSTVARRKYDLCLIPIPHRPMPFN
ncbi:hypothetical protein SLA2020_296420 [Shorea laevis]